MLRTQHAPLCTPDDESAPDDPLLDPAPLDELELLPLLDPLEDPEPPEELEPPLLLEADASPAPPFASALSIDASPPPLRCRSASSSCRMPIRRTTRTRGPTTRSLG